MAKCVCPVSSPRHVNMSRQELDFFNPSFIWTRINTVTFKKKELTSFLTRLGTFTFRCICHVIFRLFQNKLGGRLRQKGGFYVWLLFRAGKLPCIFVLLFLPDAISFFSSLFQTLLAQIKMASFSWPNDNVIMLSVHGLSHSRIKYI